MTTNNESEKAGRFINMIPRSPDPTKVKLIATSHHRNGVSGDPFDVHLIKDEDGSTKVVVDFGGSAIAVLQVDKLAANDIAFGSNSWRGDHYYLVRELAKGAEPAVAGGFFIRHGLRH